MRLVAVFALLVASGIMAAAVLIQPQWNPVSVVLGLGLSALCLYGAMRIYRGVGKATGTD